MTKLYLYSLFHLNLAFSLIPSEDYREIVENCYWPLLELAQEGVPVAIEASAHTLVEIERVEPAFIKGLKELWHQGKCEFVGSGHTQLIMPLVPADVNRWNLELGNRLYSELLGRRPTVALVNEQTFSKGLVELFKEAGYSTIIMDWANCYRYNRYQPELMYYPQIAQGVRDEIGVLWNHSIAFQKFQRAVHGELHTDEYMEFIASHIEDGKRRAFILYGNDAEVFGYRPGEGLFVEGETEKLKGLIKDVASVDGVRLVTPSALIEEFACHPLAFNRIELTSVETPLVCKKQDKYNPVRWAVSGRDNAHINASCHRIYENIKRLEGRVEENRLTELKERLCELWGSDFRTNTIDEKFIHLRDGMGWLKRVSDELVKSHCKDSLPVIADKAPSKSQMPTDEAYTVGAAAIVALKSPATVVERANTLVVDTEAVRAEFLENKGMALKGLTFKGVSRQPLVGTIPHGYYNDIQLGADFFSAHMIHATGDGKKTTDLCPVLPEWKEEDNWVVVSAEIPIDGGRLWKEFRLWKDVARVDVSYRLRVKGLVASSLRLGIFTFLPEGFDKESLWYETVNGGLYPERFQLSGHTVLHDEPVSYKVSARSCLGATEGWVRIGDKDKWVELCTDKSELYSVPMVRYQQTEDSFFFRLYHSVGEMDETAWWIWRGINRIGFTLRASKMEG